MKRKVWAMYFSATGTTEKTVTYLGEKVAQNLLLPCERFDFTPHVAREEVKTFSSDDIVILGTPVIAGRVPNLLLKYLNTIAGNGALGIPVVLFGNRNFDDALIELRDIMEKDGFKTIAAGAFVGEHSFSETLGKGRPDNDDVKDMDLFIQAILDKISEGKSNMSPVKVTGEIPIRPYYTPRDRNGNSIDIRKVKPKTNNKCINCGLCAKLCPLGSISFNNYSEVKGICMKCCACVKKCPVGAKYFDDEKYLYHKMELEKLYGSRRAKNEWFV